MSEHSILSASAANRWSICPISVTGKDSDASSRAAAEGTMLHKVCEDVLRGGAYPKVLTKFIVEDHDFTFTDDMQKDCETYVDYVRSLPWVGGYTVEGRVHYGRALGTPHASSYGTADCYGFTEDEQGRMLEVIDLKMGRKPVNPVGNPQEALYAAGVLETLSEVMLLPDAHRVRLTIFQPRLSHTPFTWVTSVGWIRATLAALRRPAQAAVRFYNKTAEALDIVEFPETVGSHCGYCRRKSDCGAIKMVVDTIAEPGKTVVFDEKVFSLRDTIRGYLDDLEELALDEALKGNVLPGTKLVQGRAGNAKLRIGEVAVREEAKKLGIEAMIVETKEVFATPAKIRDAFKKIGAPATLIAAIIEQPEGKAVIASSDDPRAAYVDNRVDVSVFAATAVKPPIL